MFGLSIGEIMLLLIVGIVVVGPKNLPSMMRTAGQWISRLRRMSTDLRSQSGIDDLIRQEGLEREIQELRSLSRMNVVDTLMTPALAAPALAAGGLVPANAKLGKSTTAVDTVVARAYQHAVLPGRTVIRLCAESVTAAAAVSKPNSIAWFVRVPPIDGPRSS